LKGTERIAERFNQTFGSGIVDHVVKITSDVTSNSETGDYFEIFHPAGYHDHHLVTHRNATNATTVIRKGDATSTNAAGDMCYTHQIKKAPPSVDYALILKLVFAPDTIKRPLSPLEKSIVEDFKSGEMIPIMKVMEVPFTYKGKQDMLRKFTLSFPVGLTAESVETSKLVDELQGSDPSGSLEIDYYDSKRTLDPIAFFQHQLHLRVTFSSFENITTPQYETPAFPKKSECGDRPLTEPFITPTAYQNFDFSGTEYEGYPEVSG
jgi:hypothetical protein